MYFLKAPSFFRMIPRNLKSMHKKKMGQFYDSKCSRPGGGGVGLLRFGSDGGVPLKPPNQYLSLRVILAEKVPIIKGF